ncbi:MAG: HAD-IA family hydrolase [Natronomonas sp.]|uniref:HAD family hydrolase n=1 Tax=Natronomonas sp. TaxID=2184060 RepID=UPI002870A0BD|nr:HAD-IA family hydrolase [Natronomonas sp.]MDR9381500.1 HAD-IA family hydrolase [Natronomonas sp.]MDR9429780.1 HAD-IA family hydrolase [Natronomonas sp.]
MTDTYEAVVFDCDGVLVEPTDREVLVDAVVDAFAAFGVDIVRSVAERTVRKDEVPVEAAREHDVDPEAFWHYRELRASLAQQAHVREGRKSIYDDVVALSRLDAPLGLVSNNQHATIEFLCTYHDLPSFDVAYGRRPTLAGAAQRKPEPDNVERALSDMGVRDALYVGDSEKDVLAAQRAGIDAAFLRRDHVADAALSVTPTFEVQNLEALVERLSPLAERP